MTPDPMTTEQIDEVERYHREDLTHRDRLRLHLAEDEQGDDWDWERPLDEDLLSEMDTLAHALASARERLEEREADMHLRIRQGYDKTAADTWREHCAEITTRAEAAERRVAELEAPGECQSIHKLQARIAELDRENLDLASQANASDAEARRRWETLETVVDQRDEARAEASRLLELLAAPENCKIHAVNGSCDGCALLAICGPDTEAETHPTTPLRVPSGVAQALIRDDSDETHPAPERKR